MSTSSGTRMYEFMVKLWPLHRTINSDDMEKSIKICEEYLGHSNYKIHYYPVKKDVMGWIIPERYHVREAWLEISGERVADFCKNSLHLLSYSLPQKIKGKLGDIRDHIYTSKKLPQSIPWEFKYYERDWGFCVKNEVLKKFNDDDLVNGVIDVEFSNEDFVLGEYYLPGESDRDMLFLTNICHPMQVNDSLTGLVVGLEMARQLEKVKCRRYGFRLLVVPETIGTIAWIDNHKKEMSKVDFAWFCEMVGHDNSFILQHSKQGSNALIDRAFSISLEKYQKHGKTRFGKFRKVVASDEMVTNGPGINIPTPSLTRWPYDEYHTSDDNPSIVDKNNLQETLDFFMDLWEILEDNYYPQRTFVGPVMLSRYGLWIDWRDDWALNLATESIMGMLEGDKSIIDIAYELQLPFHEIKKYVDKMYKHKLILKSVKKWIDSAPELHD
jgi:aminopeptidase-like protein